MTIDSDNIVDFSPNLRLVGTAHVSSKSVEMVRKEISEYEPDIVAVELCKSRLSSLKEPESLDSEDLLKIIKEGKSPMILLQSALAAQQRKMGLTTGEKPGAELLEAVQSAEESNIPVEMIDRDVVVTLRRACRGMGIFEKWRVLSSLLLEEEEEEELSIDEILGDSDMLSKMMEDARDVAPGAGVVLIDERDTFLAGRIQQISGNGKVLAVVGAGHLEGIVNNLNDPPMDISSRLADLSTEPPKKIWPKVIMAAVPLFLFGSVGYMAYNGDMEEIWQTAETWLVLNAVLAGLGVLIVRGHPLSILAGALASPITSLNPALAAGWFAGYAQIKVDAPTGGDAQEFLILDDFSLLRKIRVGKVLMVTIMGNMGSSIGAWLAGGAIFMQLFG